MSNFRGLIEARKKGRGTEDEPPEETTATPADPDTSIAVDIIEQATLNGAALSGEATPTASEPIAAATQPVEASQEERPVAAEQPAIPSAQRVIEVTVPEKGRTVNGKRSDPNYKVMSVYLRKETHRQLKFALAQDAHGSSGPQKELSELIEELAAGWLTARSKATRNGQEPSKV